jgi:CheY-like chemotaxis protein
VEDNPQDAELTLLALRKESLGDHITVVKNGVEAIDFLTNETNDKASRLSRLKLVLLDLKLPKVNGFEVLEKVKSDPSLSSIPVVILTSSAVDSDIEKAYRLGANSYIVKPIEFTAHRRAVIEAARYWLKVNNTLN